MVRSFVAGIATTIAVALLGGYVLLQSGLIPANADSQPSSLETWVAGTSLRATLRRESPTGPNPVVLNDAHLIEAVKLYSQHCAVCHGTAVGEGSASPVARGLYPRPPQLASDGVEDDPEGETYWKIKHGIRLTGMPSLSIRKKSIRF